MKQRDDKQDTQSAKLDQRQPWVKPVVQKIRAGEAEVGTRDSADGAFTTS